MKSRDVVGKRIVRVNQTRVWNINVNEWDMALDSIELDNGTTIHFLAVETAVEPLVSTVVMKRA